MVGDRYDQYCAASQPVCVLDDIAVSVLKGPQMAGFKNLHSMS